MNFWDVIFYHAHQSGGAFDTSTQELVAQTGLTRQVIGRLRQQALAAGDLYEDSSLVSGRRFVLRLSTDSNLTKGVVWKPLDYVRNGWLHRVMPAIPKRVLNLYLQQPRQRVYRLATSYIAAKCMRRFLYEDYEPAAPLNQADIGKALRLLVRLGLFVPQDDGYRIAWDTFTHPAPDSGPDFDAADWQEHPLYIQAASLYATRAAQALELVEVGNYDFEMHFQEILRDLAYVHAADYDRLKARVQRSRHRPPDNHRWRDLWRGFQRTLQRRQARLVGPKQVISLENSGSKATLTLDLSARKTDVVAVSLISRVEWPWALTAQPHLPTVELTLYADTQMLYRWENTFGDTEKRLPLPPEVWRRGVIWTFQATCTNPQLGAHVEVWLEAQVRK
ncbi:MAG TPA: hypothetical protein PKH77_27570 [Anaerolineae bacterium]|nr:hypothetical protein [Anaerolineae bacterium]